MSTSAALFVYPKFHAEVTATGVPLVGGLLYTYAPGTTTPKATYSDAAMTTPNTNPVVLDASGNAVIYMSGYCDVTLKNSAGVEQWSMLNLSGINSYTDYTVDALNDYGSGSSYTQATIAAALTGIGLVNKATLLLRPGIWAFTANANYSAYTNVTFKIVPGAVLSVATGVTVTLPGDPDAGSYQIFSLTGTGAVAGLLHPNPRWFGATGDGTTDDSTAFTAAIASVATGGALTVGDGNYAVNGLTLTVNLSMSPGAKFTYNGANNGTMMTVSGSGLVIPLIVASGDTQNCSLVRVTGNDNKIGKVILSDVIASATGTSSLYGITLPGNNNTVDVIDIRDFANTGYSNGSFPQGVYITGANNFVAKIYGDTTSALVVTGSGPTIIGEIVSHANSDNGIYQLGGTLKVGSLTYFGIDEPVVFGGTAEVGSITVIGASNSIGFGYCGDVNIGRIIYKANGTTYPTGGLRTRPDSTACGQITIGSIEGVLRSSSIVYFTIGTVDYLTIKRMDLRFIYDATATPSISAWFAFTAAKGFNFGPINITIIDEDDVLISSNYFFIEAPHASLAKTSYVDSINVALYNSDEVTPSAAGIRGYNFANPLIFIENARWQVNLGPFLKEVVASTPIHGNQAAASPAIGRWRLGQQLWDYLPAAGAPAGWVCVFRLDTTITEDISIGETADITVTNLTGVASGDIVGILQDDGNTHYTTVVDVTGGDLTITTGPVAAATSGNAIYFYRFKAMANLAP